MTADEQGRQIPNNSEEYWKKGIRELVGMLPVSFGGGSGSGQFHQINSIIAVKTAEMVNKQLSATAGSISESANRIKDSLEKTVTETGQRVSAIGDQVKALSESLAQASQKIEKAGEQSAAAASKLNRFTALLAIGTGLLFIAACWQAYETGRQADTSLAQLAWEKRQREPPAVKDGTPATVSKPPVTEPKTVSLEPKSKK